MFKKYIFNISFFLIGIAASAQSVFLAEETPVNLRETGNWNGMYLRFKFTDKLHYYGEHHLRFRNSLDNIHSFVGRTRQVYNRAGINYIPNENFNVILGPTLVYNFSPFPGDERYEKVTLEPRIWHQWLFIMPYMGRVKFYHQFRFEHRWRRSNLKGSDYNYTDRARYKFFAFIPVNNSRLDVKTLFVAPSAEIFFETGKSVYNPFEDFRIYNGIGYILNEKITFFGGHMWTFGPDKTTLSYNTSHIIRLNVLVTFDMRAAKNKVPQIHMMY
jgi:hypothetical protein